MYATVLVPVDGSDCAVSAAREAFDLAREVDATVHLLFVVDESPGKMLLSGSSMATLLEALHEEGEAAIRDVAAMATDVSVETAVVQGVDVPGAILNYMADNAVDLVIMGTRGRHGIDHLLGSTTERVLARSPVPVQVVPYAESTGDDEDQGTGAHSAGDG